MTNIGNETHDVLNSRNCLKPREIISNRAEEQRMTSSRDCASAKSRIRHLEARAQNPTSDALVAARFGF
jgi:hypothetical protein